LALVSI